MAKRRWAILSLGLLVACTGVRGDLALGTPRLLKAKEVYHVQGTSLRVTNQGASMASATDVHGNDNHYVMAHLRVANAGEEQTLSLVEGKPVSWRGFRLSIDSINFQWGKTDVTVLVEKE